MAPKLDDEDYERLLAFRDGLRRFLHWSEGEAKAVGLTGQQHQLLLAVRGHGGDPSIGDVAGHLLLRHHTVVEQVDRATVAGLLRRTEDPIDQRVVRLSLTAKGEATLASLSSAHLEELSRMQTRFATLWTALPE